MTMLGQSLQYHHIVRVIAIATSIITARHLFINGFHYPLLMALAHVSIALALGGISTRQETVTTQKRSQSWTSRFWQALFAAAVATGLIFTYHSFLHNRNATLCVMLLGLDWITPVGRGWRWLRNDKQRSVSMPLSAATFFLCVVLVLWRENWLVGKGVEFLIVAAVCAAVARHLWLSGLVDNHIYLSDTFVVDTYGAGLAVCLPLGLFLLAVTGWYNRRDFHVHGRILWILLNLVAGTLSLATDKRLKKLMTPLQNKFPLHVLVDTRFGNPIFPWLVLAIVEIDNCWAQQRPSTTSGIQWIAFVIAYLTAIDSAWLASPAMSETEPTSYMPIPNSKTQEDMADGVDAMKSLSPEDAEAMYHVEFACTRESLLRRYASLAWHTILSLLALSLALYTAIGLHSVQSARRSWDLDIVIAWYDEPVEQVISTAQLALELPNIAGRKVRTIVYNKGNLSETELETKFPTTQSSLVIRRLENVGREGDTYLAHTLESEQSWAGHTLFIQAEPHEPGYLQARLEDYFVQQTGFLTLSHVRNFCPSCDSCNDHSGWAANSTVLEEIFEQSNPGKACQDISLTYRGQFVVSSHRMKQANKELLRDLRSRLVEDKPLGFTLERSWGTIFQCPTVSERCPTLLSGWMGNRVELEDCQCLDQEVYNL